MAACLPLLPRSHLATTCVCPLLVQGGLVCQGAVSCLERRKQVDPHTDQPLGPLLRSLSQWHRDGEPMGIPSSFPDTASHKLPDAKNADTMDTAFCGNWFPREESTDNRRSQRLQGNRLVSASCDRSTVNSERWRTTEASLRIPPPRPVNSLISVIYKDGYRQGYHFAK